MSNESNLITVLTPPQKSMVGRTKTDNIILNTPSVPFTNEMQKSISKVTSRIDNLSLTPLQQNSAEPNVECLQSQSFYTVISSSGIEYRPLHDSPAGAWGGDKHIHNNVEKRLQNENQKPLYQKINKSRKSLDNILKMIIDSKIDENEEIDMPPGPSGYCRGFQETQSPKTNSRSKWDECQNEKNNSNMYYTSTTQSIPCDNNICNENTQIVNDECYVQENIFTAQTQPNSQNLEMLDIEITKNSEYLQMTNICFDGTPISQCLTLVKESFTGSCKSLNSSVEDNIYTTISPTSLITGKTKRFEHEDDIVITPPTDRSPSSQTIDGLGDRSTLYTLEANITPPIEEDRPIKWNSPTIISDSDHSDSAVTVNNNAAILYDTLGNNNLSPDLFDEDGDANFLIANKETFCNASNGELLSNYSDEYVDINIKRKFMPIDHNENAVKYSGNEFLQEFLVDGSKMYSNIQEILNYIDEI